MKTNWNIEIILKNGTKIEKVKCAEYGFNTPGNMFYFLEKREAGDMEITEKIGWIPIIEIEKVNLIKVSLFETKREKTEYFKGGK